MLHFLQVNAIIKRGLSSFNDATLATSLPLLLALLSLLYIVREVANVQRCNIGDLRLVMFNKGRRLTDNLAFLKHRRRNIVIAKL